MQIEVSVIFFQIKNIKSFNQCRTNGQQKTNFSEDKSDSFLLTEYLGGRGEGEGSSSEMV